jgi:hypothetical protein
MNIFKILILNLLLMFLISCGEESKKEVTDFDEINFFDVVYETTYYRPIGNTTWIEIVGKREMKFNVTTEVNEEEELPDNLEGYFTFAFTNYRISSLNPICNGGYSGGEDYDSDGNKDGGFVLNLFESNTSSNEVVEDPNNPWSVYDDYDNGESDIVGAEEQIKKYEFEINIGIKNFTPTDCENPFNPHNITIYRFSNGTLIYQDTSKGLEYYMRPKLRIERN